MFHNKNVMKKLASSFRKKKSTPVRSNGDQYFYITEFEQTTEKECLDFDKLNEQLYFNNLKLFNDTNKKLANTPFKLMENPQPPPRPNNYERLYLWRQRNVKLSVHDQSLAILYLLSKGINIKFLDSQTDGIEPFEVIKIAETIALEKSENMMRVVIDYLSSMKLDNIEVIEQNKQKQHFLPQQEHNPCNTELQCSNPEHHTIKKKVNFYESRSQSLNSLYPTLDDDDGEGEYQYQRRNSIATGLHHADSSRPIASAPPPEYNTKF